MKTHVTLLATALLGGFASAQLPAGPSGTQEILSATYQRLGDQRDYWFQDGEFPLVAHSLRFQTEWLPADYDLVTSLGWMYGNMDMFDLEISVYTHFMQAFPMEPEAYYPLAEFYFKKRSYPHVVAILEPSLKLGKVPHANSYRVLAHSYDRLGFFQQALGVWETYIKLNPGDQAAKLNRDKVRKKLGG